jgi:hypothetical protein
MEMALQMIDNGSGYKKHRADYAEAYAPGILSPENHARLVVDLDRVAKGAHVPKQYIYRHRMAEFCGPDELNWVKTFRRNESAGICYVGNVLHVEQRMLVIAGALLRNFVDARVHTVQEVSDAVRAGTELEGRVILVPNFHLSKGNGGDIPSWQVSGLLGFLYRRFANETKTVIYVASMKMLQAEYGRSFQEHIEDHFMIVN